MNEAEANRLVAAIRASLPSPVCDGEIRVSVLPGMILIRINSCTEPDGDIRVFVSPGSA